MRATGMALAAAALLASCAATPPAARHDASVVHRRCKDHAGGWADCDDERAVELWIGTRVYDRSPEGWRARGLNDEAAMPKPLVEQGPVDIPAKRAKDGGGILGYPLSVADLARRLPAISANDEILSASELRDSGPPPLAFLQLSPQRVAPHRSRTKLLSCECRPDRLSCRFYSYAAVFDRELRRSFLVGPDISLEQALEVARALESGRVRDASGRDRARLQRLELSSMERRHGGFELSFVDGSCGVHAVVEILHEAGLTFVRLSEPLEDVCGALATSAREPVLPRS